MKRRGRHRRSVVRNLIHCGGGDFDLRLDLIHKDFGGRVGVIHFAFDDDDLPDNHFVAELCPGLREHHKFDVALNIFDGDEAHGFACLGGVRADNGDEPRNADFFFVRGFG